MDLKKSLPPTKYDSKRPKYKDYLVQTIRNRDPTQDISGMGTARGRSKHEYNTKRIRNMEEMNVDTKR